MFRTFGCIVAFTLAACGVPSSEPYNVKFPDPGKLCCSNPDWQRLYADKGVAESLSFKVFNQNTQYIHFDYFKINDIEKMFEIKDGNIIICKTAFCLPERAAQENILMEISKLAPLAMSDFIREKMNWSDDMMGKCVLQEMRPGVWQIKGETENFQALKMRPTDMCSSHARDHMRHHYGTVFVESGGLVLTIYPAAISAGIDLSSVRYENQG